MSAKRKREKLNRRAVRAQRKNKKNYGKKKKNTQEQ